MAQVPSNLIPISVTQLPLAPVADENSLMMIVYQGNNYQIRVGDLLSVAGVPTSRQVIAGTGMTGGGQLSSNVTLSIAPGGVGSTQLANSGVTPGTYGSATSVPVFVLDAKGRVTAATSVPVSVSGFVPTSRQVIAGAGLTGGGPLNADVTLVTDFSNSAPLVLDNAGSAGVATTVSRSDHQHPAVDLSDQAQINGILPMDQGGTARSLVPSAGAIVWSGADGLYIGPAGLAGQVLVSGGAGAPTWGTTPLISDQAANVVWAGPTSGPAAPVSFRLLVNADIPTTLDGKTLTNVDINSGTIDGTTIGASTPAAGTFTSVDTDYVDFAPALSPLPTDATGRVYYDNADQFQTLAFRMNGNVVQHVGEELFYRIKCQGSITKGQVVSFAGSVGASGGLIGKAATGLTADQANYILGVADETGSNNDWIFVTSFGEVKNIDTTGGVEAWTQGQVLYYNPAVTGGLTKTKPTTPNAIALVAAVVHVGSSNGILFVRPVYGSVLGGTDGNVQFGTLNNGDVIVYDGTDQRWENVAQSSLAVGTATNIAGGAANRIVYNTGAGATSFVAAPTVANTYLEWSGAAFQWSTNPLGTVTSVGGTGTVSGITLSGTVTTSGSLTLGGSLDLSSPPTIGGTVANSITGTTITANTQFSGAGTGLTGTATGLSIGGNAATATSATSATTATNLAGGAASQIPYQTGAGATTFLANGTAGQILKSNGASAPTWSAVDGGTF